MEPKYKRGDVVWYQHVLWKAPAIHVCSGVVSSVSGPDYGGGSAVYRLKGDPVEYYDTTLFASREACLTHALAWVPKQIEGWAVVQRELNDKLAEAAGYADFCDDAEKMADFCIMSKEAFLYSYSYLTEEEYDLTRKKVEELCRKSARCEDV